MSEQITLSLRNMLKISKHLPLFILTTMLDEFMVMIINMSLLEQMVLQLVHLLTHDIILFNGAIDLHKILESIPISREMSLFMLNLLLMPLILSIFPTSIPNHLWIQL
jgi:hypothetical protein